MKTTILVTLLALFIAGSVYATPVNVSCTDSPKSLNKIHEGSFTAVCPINCKSGSVWGTNNVFTTDSAMCVAAVHEGTINQDGGTISIRILGGRDSYNGQMKNGVLTQSWGSYETSFSVSKLK